MRTLLAICVIPWLASCAVSAAEFARVEGIRAEAVIVPAAAAKEQIGASEFSGFWTPTAADIRGLEERLAGFIKREAVRDKRRSSQISEVHRRLPEYRRQYVGVISDGRKLILLNAFPRRDSGEPYFPDWKRELVEVSDGGASYWKVFYDPHRQKFDFLAINGVA